MRVHQEGENMYVGISGAGNYFTVFMLFFSSIHPPSLSVQGKMMQHNAGSIDNSLLCFPEYILHESVSLALYHSPTLRKPVQFFLPLFLASKDRLSSALLLETSSNTPPQFVQISL